MKKTLLLIPIILLFSLLSFSQSKNKHYVFDDFKEGIAEFKDGTQKKGLLNYNGLTSNFVLKDKDGKVLELSKSEANNVEIVFVEDRRFIYRDNKFYELLLINSQVELLVEYNCTLKTNTENRNAYGSSSQTTSTVNITTFENQGTLNSILLSVDLPAAYMVDMKLRYILTDKKGTNFFKSLNQIKKHYKSHKKEYTAYRKAKDVDFYDPISVAKMISYLKSLG